MLTPAWQGIERAGSSGPVNSYPGLKLEAVDHERHQSLPAVEAHITGQGPQIVEEDLAREELAQGPIAGIE